MNVPPGSECGVIRSESASSSSGTVTVIIVATESARDSAY